MNNQVGQDSTGQWNAAQHAIDSGWDYTCIVATAEKGVSETDAEGLSESQQSELLAYCGRRVAERTEAATE